MQYGIDNLIWNAMQAIFRAQPKVAKVYLFGSRARGEAEASSDIDLAVSAPAMQKAEFGALWNALDDLPHIFKMDVLWLESLENTLLKEQILRDGKEVYSCG